MPDEILNIEHHTKRLITKALNKYKTIGAAAIALGINERSLYNYIDQYRIIRVEKYVVDDEDEYLKAIPKGKNQFSKDRKIIPQNR